mmetsp:Transcript_14939/g.20884  ORF Transcript_14939/g.20884 Transcript_14939/m.20884 type:complete len:549 (+) Transcript_14939:78-1724(+)
MTTPSVVVHLIETTELVEPNYWKENKKFHAYCRVTIINTRDPYLNPVIQKGKELTLTQKSTSPVKWDQKFTLQFDISKLTAGTAITIIDVEIWQNASSKQILLGKLQLDAKSLIDDSPLDTWAPLVHGKFHVNITRHNFAPYIPPPAYAPQPAYAPPPQPLPQQPIGQYAPPTAPPSNPYAYNPYSNPYALPQQPTQFPQQPPPQYAPQPIPQQPMTAPPSYSNAHTLLPAQPIQTGPPLPPKVAIPAEYDKLVVLAVMAQSVQAVTEKILSDYFKYCGNITHLIFEKPVVLLTFEKDFEADTALFLDNGFVCGGPIRVFRYRDQGNQNLPHEVKSTIEVLAKQFLDRIQNGNQPQPQPLYDAIKVDTSASTTDVYVTNASLQATAQVLIDFFTYCGKVHAVEIYKEYDHCLSAVVHFLEAEAADTAILLTGAFIYDKPIQVCPLNKEIEENLKKLKTVSSATEPTKQPSNSNTESHEPEKKKTKTSVVQSLMAAGYDVGSQVAMKAKAYDERQLGGAVAHTIDYVSHKASQGKDYVVSAWKNWNKKS